MTNSHLSEWHLHQVNLQNELWARRYKKQASRGAAWSGTSNKALEAMDSDLR